MVELERSGSVSTVWLDFDDGNLINFERIQEIIEVHQKADADPLTKVIVTRSKRKNVFCMGFDPQYIVDKSIDDRASIFKGISLLIYNLLSLKRPHISVIEGPAMAGGAVLAILSDYRLFCSERAKFSFSEAKVGLALPSVLIDTIAAHISPAWLREVACLGKNIDAKQGQICGVANWVSSPEGIEEKLALECSKIARLSPYVLEVNKKRINKKLIKKAKKLIKSKKVFEPFMGDDLLGEGLSALIERRAPEFKK
ncbi:MAG: enoyl-CoA hydratase/isomerase family protein [Bacteriovoracaceae bacterium]|jgi:enoyl-CoA hydratase/carnithine racemase|nr:enoyl-CoA hydratase/isomerase family protein [Bacteriovoracaceae bacterium]